MRTLVFAAIAAALTPVAGTADVTRMGFVVNPIDATSFEVPWRGRSGPRTFWCAAGDYVRYDLNMPGLALIGGGNSISASHALLQCNRR